MPHRSGSGEPRQLLGIMGTEHCDLAITCPGEIVEPCLVPSPHPAVNLHHSLIGAQAGGAAWLPGVNLIVIEIGITRVQQPA